ncbi:hypothetical protein PN836_016495 [Ningiella sp. W23]|uniref:hypothetical protein n=1 Tax=Ningiella sp. W23 TaxID=3023715 RepID=UPI003756E0A8
MLVKEFVDKKAEQLAFYLESYWQDKVAFKEMDRFIWDILEEWSALKNTDKQIYSQKERVFWHVIYQVQFVGGHSLRHDCSIRDQVQLYTHYLNEDSPCPLDVIGMRP